MKLDCAVYEMWFFPHDVLWPSSWVSEHASIWPLPQSSSSTDISAPCLSQLTLIDLVIYASLEAVNIRGVRWSRALRPVFLINFPESRQVRMWFRIHKMVFFFIFFYWSVVESQCCVNCCCTMKWLSYTFTCTFSFVFFSVTGRRWVQLSWDVECSSLAVQ